MAEIRRRQPSLLLDFRIVAIAAALLILVLRFGLEAGHSAAKGAGTIFGGAYLIYLGVLFLLSYFFSGACYVFNLLTYLCEACSHSASRHWAWFYFVLNVVIGSYLVLMGLGFLH